MLTKFIVYFNELCISGVVLLGLIVYAFINKRDAIELWKSLWEQKGEDDDN